MEKLYLETMESFEGLNNEANDLLARRQHSEKTSIY